MVGRCRCVVATCDNKATHNFPRDKVLCQQWIKASRLNTQKKFGLGVYLKSSRLCSSHFKQSDYVSPTINSVSRRKVLKRGVIPSIFSWTQVSQDNKESKSTKITIEDPLSTTQPLHNQSTCGSTVKTLLHNQPTCNDLDVSFNPSNVVHTYSRPVLPTTFVEELSFLGTEKNDLEEDPLRLNNENQKLEPQTKEPPASAKEKENSCNTNNNDLVGFTESTEIDTTDHINEKKHTPEHCTCCKLKESKCDQASQTLINAIGRFTIQTYKHNRKAIHFYTGLETFDKVMLVFHTLGQDAYHLKYYNDELPTIVDPLDQFCMTLIILRQHKTFSEISIMFLMPVKLIYSVFVTWIRFMYLQWKKLDLWVDKETGLAYMPLDFYDKYPATRVVLKAKECPVKKPKLPLAQRITYSVNQNRNKFLLDITPSGFISYISPCYGGSATDRQIIERSAILSKFNYGDEIMVNKGLKNVKDIFLSYGVKVNNMPPFSKKVRPIQPETLTSNRKIASKEEHVKRVIGSLKTYKILIQPMNRTETLLSSEICFVCAMLLNFRSNIVGKNA